MDAETEYFIEVIKHHQCLYNLCDTNYKNIKFKALAWADVAHNTGHSVEDCKKKWKGLRSSFIREMNKRKMSGDNVEDATKGWSYFNQLLFLKRNTIGKSKTTTNYSYNMSELSSKNENYIVSNWPSTSPLASQPPCKRTKTTKTELLKAIKQLISSDMVEDDEEDLFGQIVAKKLRKFNETERNTIRIGVLQYISEKEVEFMRN